jgi:hypothetical protein
MFDMLFGLYSAHGCEREVHVKALVVQMFAYLL